MWGSTGQIMTGKEEASQEPREGVLEAVRDLGQLLVNESCQLSFAHGADFGGGQLTVFEDHEGGNTANAKFGGNVTVFIDIHFGDLQLALVTGSHFVQNGRNHFARAAPFCPKVDDHGLCRLQDICVKCSVSGVFDQIAGHGLFLVEIEFAAKVSL